MGTSWRAKQGELVEFSQWMLSLLPHGGAIVSQKAVLWPPSLSLCKRRRESGKLMLGHYFL